MYIRAFMY